MPLRDILVTAIVLGSIPFTLRRPTIGILMWCWISYMNPHRLSWGFAYSFPFALIIAIATFIGLLIGSERKQLPPLTPLTFLWLLFFLWAGITTVFAVLPDTAFTLYWKSLKVQIMTVATIAVICDRKRLNLLIWAIVLSIGFFAVKGGIFTLTQGGANRVWGPPDSYIADNNALALATFMLLPLVYYLRSHAKHRGVRMGLLVAMVLMTVSAVGSYSRGGLIAGFSMAAFFCWKSRHKIAMGLAVTAIIPLLFLFMPAQWHARMDTILNYEQDASAMNRIEAWIMAYNLANDRVLGGGYGLWSPQMYARYGPNFTKSPGTRGAHSIYFGVLGEHGWIGLILFLSIFFLAWRTASWIVRMTRHDEDHAWLADLSRMIQVSFVAYATGGAFESLSYWDYPWHLVAILVISRQLTEDVLKERVRNLTDEIEVPGRRRPLRLRGDRPPLAEHFMRRQN